MDIADMMQKGGIMMYPLAVCSVVLFAVHLAAGVIIGVVIDDIENHAVLTNFIIMPMAFFSGTFYPVDFLPHWLQKVVWLLPLSHANMLIRAGELTVETMPSFILLLGLTAVCFTVGTVMLDRYNE
ncbi:MAG: ABC transporter permease [Deferribacterales bacterium]